MKGSALIRSVSLLSFAVIVTWLPVTAQTRRAQVRELKSQVDRSKPVSTEALRISEAGDPNKALEVARTGLRTCPEGTLGSSCRGLLNYTLGFIFQQQAQITATADRNRILNQAAASYQAALRDDPDNSTIHYNFGLVLGSLGEQNEALAEMERARQADPKQWQYGLNLGDLYARQKYWPAALQAYEQAAQAAPAADAPSERILELTRQGHGLSTTDLKARCAQWQTIHPSLAPACYEQYITLVHANNNSDAESAFVNWLDACARQDRVDAQLLDGLPQDWETAAIPPLRAALRGDLSGAADNWWTRSAQQREVWARFLLALGQQSAASDPKIMERIWQTGLNIVKNGPPSASALELRRELALLYVRLPNMDPGQRKLNELVEQIFQDKMGAIESKDLEAEQRYHTVLGLIFAGQQNWGTDYNPHSAAFQLKRTVEVAEERYRKEGIYQPLPEIKELRARVYEKANRPEDAANARWAAILANMDSDRLDRAAQALEAFQDSGNFDKATLTSLLKTRRTAAGVAAGQTGSLIKELSTVQPKAGILPDFVQRQQFKALADMAAASPAGTEEDQAVQAALKAFSLATEQHVPLVGVNDLERWQVVQRRLVNSVGGRSERVQVRPGGGAALKLMLPGSTLPQSVEVSPQTVQAANVVEVLGTDKLASFKASMSLSNGKLAVSDKAVASPEVRRRLEMKGVKVVSVPQ